MSEGSLEKVSYVDPFCGIVSKKKYAKKVIKEVDWNLQQVLGVELDKETGNTKVVVTGEVNIDKEIQERVNDSGFEGMRRLIATGQARPIDFMDDGKHGVDATKMPDNVNDAYRAALAANDESNGVFGKLGVNPVYNADGSINMEATESALTNAIKSAFEQLNKEKNDAQVK